MTTLETKNQTNATEAVAVEEKLHAICAAIDEAIAREPKILDVRGQTLIADYFLVCSGTSITHIRSIAQRIVEDLETIDNPRGAPRVKPQGSAESYWIILDYSDIIVHIFSEETRDFYDLERLWSDAKEVAWPTESGASTQDESSSDASAEAAK
jgi:ribosome-associated protein